MDALISRGEYYSDSSDTDIEYKRFLDNLKEDGTSYIFESASTFIKYEGDPKTSAVQLIYDSSETETEIEKQRKACCYNVKIEGEDEHLSNGHEELRCKFSTDGKGRHKVNSLTRGKANTEPCYEIFLNHLQYWVDGSFLLESDDGMLIMYGDQLMLPSEGNHVLDESLVFDGEPCSDSSVSMDICTSNYSLIFFFI